MFSSLALAFASIQAWLFSKPSSVRQHRSTITAFFKRKKGGKRKKGACVHHNPSSHSAITSHQITSNLSHPSIHQSKSFDVHPAITIDHSLFVIKTQFVLAFSTMRSMMALGRHDLGGPKLVVFGTGGSDEAAAGAEMGIS